MTKHQHTAKKQGKPFLACPKGRKQKGKEPQSEGRHRAVAVGQVLRIRQSCETACPERTPLLSANKLPHQGENRCANERTRVFRCQTTFLSSSAP